MFAIEGRAIAVLAALALLAVLVTLSLQAR